MSRKTARDSVFKIVFEKCVTGEDNEITYGLLTTNFDNDDLNYVSTTVNGINAKYGELKDIIGRYATSFAIDRIYKIDLAILFLAIYEILFTDVPVKVAANEAIELSKTYSTDKSSPFINGILATIIKEKESILSDLNKNEVATKEIE